MLVFIGLNCNAENSIKSSKGKGGTFNDAGSDSGKASDADFKNPNDNGDDEAGTVFLDADNQCAEVDLKPKRIIPKVIFVIDGSGSMTEELSGGGQRWTTLRQVLLDANEGIVPQLAQIVEFGMVIYSGPKYANQYCPRLIYARPVIEEYELLDKAFTESPPGGSTPTGLAIEWTLENVFQQLNPNDETPEYIVLATDGKPNACVEVNGEEPQTDFDSVIKAVKKIKDAGITVSVITLAPAEGEYAEHLDEVADIGGPGDGTGKALAPENKQELISDMRKIIQSAISCEVELQGEEVLEEHACKGTVELISESGEPQKLKCNGKNGWELMEGGTKIKLKGKACTQFKEDPSIKVSASFPCIALVG